MTSSNTEPLSLTEIKCLSTDINIVVLQGAFSSKRDCLFRELDAIAYTGGIYLFKVYKDANIDVYPNADIFKKFVQSKGDPYDLWRAVVLRWIAKQTGITIPTEDWPSTVNWLTSNPEVAAHVMQQRPQDWLTFIVFDVTEFPEEEEQRAILQGLLRTLDWLKRYLGLYGKVFLNEKQALLPSFKWHQYSHRHLLCE